MHGKNYHGREITVNIAKPRGPDPKKEGVYQNTYSGRYDAGGRLRPEYRGSEWANDPRYDRDDRPDADRERDFRVRMHSHGHSYDGSGRYGDRDPRPVQARYD